MKRAAALLAAFLFIFSGCYAEPEPPAETPAVVSAPSYDLERLGAIVKDILNSLYWKYDPSSLFFEEENLNLGGADDRRRAEMEAAAESIGLDMTLHAGGAATVAGVNLLQMNDAPAGRAKFYFSNGAPFCAYYSPTGDDNARRSLRDRNFYLIADPFEVYEDESMPYPEPVAVSRENLPLNTSVSEKNKTYGRVLATIVSDKLLFFEYTSRDTSFVKLRELATGGLVPIDFAFTDGGGCAVLLGETDGGWDGAKEYVSKRLDVYDKNYNHSFITELGAGYTAAASCGDSLALCRDNVLEFYELRRNGIVKRSQAILTHRVASLAYGGDSVLAATDGTDLYLYRLKERDIPELICRTHSAPTIADARVSVCDMNGDGAAEFYLTGLSAACVRYAPGKHGLRGETAGDARGVYVVGILVEGGYTLMTYDGGAR